MIEEKKVGFMDQKSNLNTDLTIRANKTSVWGSKGPDWNISLVDQDTFRFSAADTEEYFDQSLVVIEEHAHLVQLPMVSYALISLKLPKQKTITFRIDKKSITIWNEMKGPPTVRSLALTLKQATKSAIPWAIMLIVFSLQPMPGLDEEKEQLIHDLNSALLGISLIGIVAIARKIPQANFFLFQMAWDLIFLCNILVNEIDVSGDTNLQLILTASFVICLLLFFRYRITQHYENYKRFSDVTE